MAAATGGRLTVLTPCLTHTGSSFMSHKFKGRLAALFIGSMLIGTAVMAAAPLGGKLALTAQQVKYSDTNPNLPGMQSATLVGDINQKGTYVLRNRFPPDFILPPHKHAENRIVTVLEGTVYFGYTKDFDPSQTKAYGPGSLFVEHKGDWHLLMTQKEGAVVQVIAEGPMTTEFIPPPGT
jgi:quercetin dioxygenase-like cupin family protein